MAQLQKQKKKANKKASTATDTPKDAESAKEADTTEEPVTEPVAEPVPETTSPEIPAEEKPQEETVVETESAEQPEEQEQPEKLDAPVESPVEPMPPAPTSPGPETEAQSARLDTPRAGHTRQPSLSIQSKMRSSSFRKTSVSHGSPSPSPAATLKSPPQSLPPLTGDGESAHEVFQKQSTRISELEKDNKRMEKELADATSRWRKTEDQLEDLRESSVDVPELKEQLKKAEEKAASIETLVRISCLWTSGTG